MVLEICPDSNLKIVLNSPSLKFHSDDEGKREENKTEANISPFTEGSQRLAADLFLGCYDVHGHYRQYRPIHCHGGRDFLQGNPVEQ